MMKRLIILLTTFSIFLSCNNQNHRGFNIRGNIEGLGNCKLELIKFLGETESVDTIIVVDNKFVYSGTLDEPCFVQIYLQKNDTVYLKISEFLLENTEINIESNYLDLDSVIVTGSESNIFLQNFWKSDGEFGDRIFKLEDKLNNADDTLKKKIYDECEILRSKRIQNLKLSIKKYSDSEVSALLPLFCNAQKDLSYDDWNEIYAYLDPHIQKSMYGELINRIIHENFDQE